MSGRNDDSESGQNALIRQRGIGERVLSVMSARSASGDRASYVLGGLERASHPCSSD